MVHIQTLPVQFAQDQVEGEGCQLLKADEGHLVLLVQATLLTLSMQLIEKLAAAEHNAPTENSNTHAALTVVNTCTYS